MKILAITALYPPGHAGGYEIRTKDIIDGLSGRGHEAMVITSRREPALGLSGQAPAYAVLRKLRVRMRSEGPIDRLTRWRTTHSFGMLLTFVRQLLRDFVELRLIERLIQRHRPDVIYLGHITCLSRSIMPYLAGQSMPLVYDEGGSGLIDCWTEKNIWYKFTDELVLRQSVARAIKSLVVGVVCQLSGARLKPRFAWPANMHILFNDDLNYRNAIAKGVPVNGAKVIRSGIDTAKFRFRARSGLSVPVRIVIPGRIEPRKGQMDGVRLLAKLRENDLEANTTIVGATWSDPYYREVTEEVRKLELENKVQLMPMTTQAELVALYQEADICFFPSHYRTGFSRVPLEAMACGCILICYGNEGSNEIIRDRYNGFLVPYADLTRIADIIRELMADPDRVRDIALAARRDIEERHSMQRYVDEIEAVFVEANRGRQ